MPNTYHGMCISYILLQFENGTIPCLPLQKLHCALNKFVHLRLNFTLDTDTVKIPVKDNLYYGLHRVAITT